MGDFFHGCFVFGLRQFSMGYILLNLYEFFEKMHKEVCFVARDRMIGSWSRFCETVSAKIYGKN
jgi:hypothetical protein